MLERFARETQATVRRAAEIAESEAAAMVQSEHLLLALVDPPRGSVGRALHDTGISAVTIQGARAREFQSALAAVGVDTTRPAPAPPARLRRGRVTRFAPSAKLALERTVVAATSEGAHRITNRHLLIGIADAEVGSTPVLLKELSTSREELLRLANAERP